MIGSFITRGLLMVFGYAYPAYECFKTVEKNKPEIEQLRFWCQYWILVAILTVSERIGDAFISWVPMYSEAKLAFYIYLWYPKTKGTTYVYNSFFRPYVAKHETEIDRNLLELKVRAGDIAGSYWQKAASYGQTRVLEILQYIASRSTPRPRPVQPQNSSVRVRQNSGTAQPQSEVPLTPVSSASGEGLDEVQEVSGHSQMPQGSLPPNTQSKSIAAALNTRRTISLQLSSEVASASTATEVEAASSANQNANPPQKETLMEEAVRVTRATLRKARTAASR